MFDQTMEKNMKKLEKSIEQMERDVDKAMEDLNESLGTLDLGKLITPGVSNRTRVKRNYPRKTKVQRQQRHKGKNRDICMKQKSYKHSLSNEIKYLKAKNVMLAHSTHVWTANRSLMMPEFQFTDKLTMETVPHVFHRSLLGRLFRSSLLPPYCVEVDDYRIYMVFIEYELKHGNSPVEHYLRDWKDVELNFLREVFRALDKLGIAEKHHYKAIEFINQKLNESGS